MSSEVDTLIAKVENLEEKLKSAEENKTKEVQEEEKTEAKKATFKAALENMDEKQKAATLKSIKAQDDEDMKKIANDYEDKHMTSKKSRKAMEDEDKDGNDDKKDDEKDKLEAKVRNLTSRISDYEATEKTKLMTELTALKSSLIVNLDEDIYKTKLSAKTFSELKTMVDDRKDEFLALQAVDKQPEKKHFGFSAKTQNTQKLTSASSILTDGGIA